VFSCCCCLLLSWHIFFFPFFFLVFFFFFFFFSSFPKLKNVSVMNHSAPLYACNRVLYPSCVSSCRVSSQLDVIFLSFFSFSLGVCVRVCRTGEVVGDEQGFCEPELCLLRLFAAHDVLLVRQGPVGVQLVRPRESLHAQRKHLPAHRRQRRERKLDAS